MLQKLLILFTAIHFQIFFTYMHQALLDFVAVCSKLMLAYADTPFNYYTCNLG